MQTQPGFEGLTCRYTDGLTFESGPPNHECAEGAHPAAPFCGGSCGDTCPANPGASIVGGQSSCIGRSETRGFGVCVHASWRSRCWIGQNIQPDTNPFAACRGSIAAIEGEGQDCLCMMLSPVLLDEFADYGWAVAEQTCAAYQARYPDQVRCIPPSEL